MPTGIWYLCRRRGGEDSSDKSNNPHLAGGEQTQTAPGIWSPLVDLNCPWHSSLEIACIVRCRSNLFEPSASQINQNQKSVSTEIPIAAKI